MDGKAGLGIIAALLAAAGAAQCAEVSNVAKTTTFGPPKGAKWEPIGEMTDEFAGGKLDAGKWHDHNPTWKGRQPAFFAKHNVAVRDGKCHLTMRKEDMKGLPAGYHTFTSAAVQSKALVRYGYFEIKCRPMDSHGSSAFWFYAQTPEVWTEIDMFEMGAGAPKHERTVYANVHVFHTLVNPDRHWDRSKPLKMPFRLADGWHVYALEWGPDEVKFYVDGKVLRTAKNTHWHQPLTMNFDSETMGGWFGLPKAKDLPSTFSIEYVRSWRRAGGYGDERYRSCEITFSKAEAAAAKGKTKRYRIKADGGGTLVVVAKHGGSPRPRRVHLEYDDEQFFKWHTAVKMNKTIPLKDAKGKKLALTFTWSWVKGHKANHGYRADWVDISPAERPAKGEAAVVEFAAEGGRKVRMKLQY